MSQRILVERYDFDEQSMKDYSVSGILVQEFVQWMLNTSLWKEYPELMVDKAMILRKKLLEDLKPDVDPLRETNTARSADGRLKRRNS